MAQQLLTETIVEEVPLCMPPPQFPSQPYSVKFGESDVEELFNGADDKQDTTENWPEPLKRISTWTISEVF